MPRKPGKMQQHREACCTLNQRAYRRAAKTKDEVSLPVTRHRAIGRFGGRALVLRYGRINDGAMRFTRRRRSATAAAATETTATTTATSQTPAAT